MKDASFRVIHFPKSDTYAAVAWNYSESVLLATSGHLTYTDSREALDKICLEHNVRLRWFDGEYSCTDGETLGPIG